MKNFKEMIDFAFNNQVSKIDTGIKELDDKLEQGFKQEIITLNFSTNFKKSNKELKS